MLKRAALFLGLVVLIVVAPALVQTVSRAVLEAIVDFLTWVLAGGGGHA